MSIDKANGVNIIFHEVFAMALILLLTGCATNEEQRQDGGRIIAYELGIHAE